MAAALLAAFLATPWPRELVALAGAGALLTSRRMHSREMLGLVDWQLLVLFTGLFVVNDALAGNLLLVGSIANLIVADAAAAAGAPLDWRTHLRTGIPVTAATLALAAGWLALRAA